MIGRRHIKLHIFTYADMHKNNNKVINNEKLIFKKKEIKLWHGNFICVLYRKTKSLWLMGKMYMFYLIGNIYLYTGLRLGCMKFNQTELI